MTQQNLNPNETVIAEATDGTQLILFRDLVDDLEERDGGPIPVTEIDHDGAAVRFHHDDPHDGPTSNDMEFEKFRDARLAYGLWLECGPFHQPESSKSVPREIALSGQDAITAYIHLNNGWPLAREGTASICDVTEQTVSDRLSRIRWIPDQLPAENTE